jgi:SAM-dependent methyltransferase
MPEFTVEFSKTVTPDDADRLDGPAFHRNQAAIAPVLESFLRVRSGDVLEIGSGTGQHAVEYARRLPSVTWWPTDYNDKHLRSIAAWRAYAQLDNLREPTKLDASAADWQLAALSLPERFIAMFCANVIHIAPWVVAQGLFAGASRHLSPGGRLFLYGPFRHGGIHNSPGNQAFDKSLRARNSDWGVRDTADLKKLGETNGLRLAELVEMPANNAVLAFERV